MVGDVDVRTKREGTMRVVAANLRRVKTDSNTGMGETVAMRELVTVLQTMGADVLCAADTGLENGTAARQAKLWSAGIAECALREWGGKGQTWIHSEGMKRNRGRAGGAAVVTASSLKGFAARKIVDSRGAGRYVLRELTGSNGMRMVVGACYLACWSESEGMWQQQLEMMGKLKGELADRAKTGARLSRIESEVQELLNSEEATPKTLALMDMKHDLLKLKADYIVVGGDWNTCPPGAVRARGSEPTSENRKSTEAVEKWMGELALVEPLSRPDERALQKVKNRLGGADPNKVRTYHGAGSSWIDYFLVSRSMDERGLIRATAVMGDGLNGSDHKAVVLDVDMEAALGKSSVWEDVEAAVAEASDSNMNAEFKAIKLRQNESVKKFQLELLRRCPRGGRVERRVIALSKQVNEHWDQMALDGDRTAVVQRELDEGMEAIIQAMVKAQRSLREKQPKAGSRFKHWASSEYVELARTYRVTRRLVGLWDRNDASNSAAGMQGRVAKAARIGVEFPRFTHQRALPGERESREAWANFIGRLRAGLDGQARLLHGKARKQMKGWRRERQGRLKDWVKKGQLGRAFDNALARVRDGAVNSAHVVEWKMEGCSCVGRCCCGRGHLRRVVRAARSGAEVRDSQLQYMEEWMGSKKVKWFHFSDGSVPEDGARNKEDPGHLISRLDEEGFDFRCRLARGEASEEELRSIPTIFKGMVTHLRRKFVPELGRRIEPGDYKEAKLLREVTATEWAELWRKTKAGTRGGASGQHVNMIKAAMREVTFVEAGRSGTSERRCLTMHVVEMLRMLVNVARKARLHCKHWRQELLYTFIKVPGGVGLADSRPVGLLEVTAKANKALDYAGIAKVWEEKGVLHESQHAFRRGRGTEGILMLWLLGNEECYRSKVDQAKGQGDLRRAYDSVYQWVVESALLRLGLPEEFVRYEADLMRDKETRLITAFGLTSAFRRAAGLPQGGTESCQQFNAVMDMLACAQEAMATERGVVIPDEWGAAVELHLGMFCDDTHYGAAGERCVAGLEERFRIAALWSAFLGMEHRPDKCNATVGMWTKERDANRRRLLRQEEHKQQVVMTDEFEGKQSNVPMLDPHQCERGLGVQVSLAGYSDGAVKRAAVEVEETALAVKRMPRVAGLALSVASMVGWRRLAYRLRFTNAAPTEVDKVCMPLKRVVLSKVGLHPGAARAAVATMVWMQPAVEIQIERLVQMLTILDGKGIVRRGLEGSVQQLQRYVGCEEPVLETDRMRCTCVEELGAAQSCGNKVLTATGSKMCRTSCGWNGTWVGLIYWTLCNTKLRVTGGLGMPKLRDGDRCLTDLCGPEEREVVRRGCLANEKWRLSEVLMLDGERTAPVLWDGQQMQRTAGREWVSAVRATIERLRAERGGELKLGGWHREAVWSWQVCAWVRGSELRLGKACGPQHRGKVKVRELQMTRANIRAELRGGQAVSRGSAVWNKLQAVWSAGGLQSAEQELEAEQLRPVVWRRVEGMRAEQVWVVVDEIDRDTAEQLGLEVQGGGAENSHFREEPREEGWSPEVLSKVIGEEQGGSKYEQRRRQAEAVGDWGELDIFSDGGVDEPATTEAQAQYGWCVGGTAECFELWAAGGGVVEGYPEDMDSNRAELRAALAVLCKVRAWKGAVTLWIDNENVQRGLERMAEGTQPADIMTQGEEHTNARAEEGGWGIEETIWLRSRQDRDLWEVAAEVVGWFGGRLSVHWQKSHQDTRKSKVSLTKYERGNIKADEMCNRYKGVKAEGQRLILPRRRSWRLSWEGRETLGPWRAELKERFDTMMVLHHFAEVRGWGKAAEEWLGNDIGYWKLRNRTVAQRIQAAQCMYAMWETEDVIAKRRNWGGAGEVSCSLCGQNVREDFRSWHLLAKCTDAAVVAVRRRALKQVKKHISKEQGPRYVSEILEVPWMLDDEGKLREMGDCEGLRTQLGMPASSPVSKLCQVVQGEGGLERRQMVYKGMMGREWDNMLQDWGFTATAARRLRKRVFVSMQEVLPEMARLHHKALFKEHDEEMRRVDERAIQAARLLWMDRGGRAPSRATMAEWRPGKRKRWTNRVLDEAERALAMMTEAPGEIAKKADDQCMRERMRKFTGRQSKSDACVRRWTMWGAVDETEARKKIQRRLQLAQRCNADDRGREPQARNAGTSDGAARAAGEQVWGGQECRGCDAGTAACGTLDTEGRAEGDVHRRVVQAGAARSGQVGHAGDSSGLVLGSGVQAASQRRARRGVEATQTRRSGSEGHEERQRGACRVVRIRGEGARSVPETRNAEAWRCCSEPRDDAAAVASCEEAPRPGHDDGPDASGTVAGSADEQGGCGGPACGQSYGRRLEECGVVEESGGPIKRPGAGAGGSGAGEDCAGLGGADEQQRHCAGALATSVLRARDSGEVSSMREEAESAGSGFEEARSQCGSSASDNGSGGDELGAMAARSLQERRSAARKRARANSRRALRDIQSRRRVQQEARQVLELQGSHYSEQGASTCRGDAQGGHGPSTRLDSGGHRAGGTAVGAAMADREPGGTAEVQAIHAASYGMHAGGALLCLLDKTGGAALQGEQEANLHMDKCAELGEQGHHRNREVRAEVQMGMEAERQVGAQANAGHNSAEQAANAEDAYRGMDDSSSDRGKRQRIESDSSDEGGVMVEGHPVEAWYRGRWYQGTFLGEAQGIGKDRGYKWQVQCDVDKQGVFTHTNWVRRVRRRKRGARQRGGVESTAFGSALDQQRDKEDNGKRSRAEGDGTLEVRRDGRRKRKRLRKTGDATVRGKRGREEGEQMAGGNGDECRASRIKHRVGDSEELIRRGELGRDNG